MKAGNINFIIVTGKKREVNISFDNIDKINCLVIDEIKNGLLDIIRTPRTHVLLNMSKIRFIDSAGFQALNQLENIGRNYGSSLSIVNPHKELVEIIELEKLHNIFKINVLEKKQVEKVHVLAA